MRVAPARAGRAGGRAAAGAASSRAGRRRARPRRTPWSASSTTTARLYAGVPSPRLSTKSSTDALERPVEAVGEADPLAARVEAQRRRPAGALALGALGRAQPPARARVGALGSGPCAAEAAFADLRARAPAGVDVPRAAQRRERVAVELARARTAARPARPSRARARAGRRAARPRARAASGRGRGPRRARGSAPPPPRANSHASSAVRRLPRCSGPLGLGAKRPSAGVLTAVMMAETPSARCAESLRAGCPIPQVDPLGSWHAATAITEPSRSTTARPARPCAPRST